MGKRMYEDLKEILCHELNEITRRGDIDREGLDDVYKLSSAITMVESLMKKQQGQGQQEGEYSQGYSQEGMSNRMNMRRSYEGGMSNDGSYDSMSYERGTTDGRDMGRSRAYDGNSRDYSREGSYDYSERRGRGADGRYVSRDSYDNYANDYSRHTAEQMVVSKLQDILANTSDQKIRKAIMQAMEKIDN